MRRLVRALALLVLALGLAAVPASLVSRVSDTSDFVHFESAHVHPLALTPSGDRLLAVNTPDNRLVIFALGGPAPVRIADVPVGLEPVSVAALSDSEAWVVNQLSDDVSIVNLNTFHTRTTLRVGDEPSDVVFAGAGPRAYVSVSQEDAVKVYDPQTLALLQTIAIPGRMPRALARTADGSRVYAAVLFAGNRTSVLSEDEVGANGAPPPSPPRDPSLPPPPVTGLIVRQQGTPPNHEWVDEAGQVWNTSQNPSGAPRIAYTLVDTDVARISTATNSVDATFGDIGSANFGLAVSPADARVAVTATEPRNLTRFEPNLRGHMVDTRAALVTAAGSVEVFDLNPALDYSVTPGPPSERQVAIGIPTGAAFRADGQRLYVTALANDRLAEVDVAGGVPFIARRAPTVAGPTGVVVDDLRGRIYVLGRFQNQLQTLSATSLAEVGRAALGFDPTPDPIVNGRKFFYGGFTSGHGDQACASCHLFGDFDNLAWDLGNPQGTMQPIDRTGQVDPTIDGQVHPMKGPMTTQSLRGLSGTGMLHWRADRQSLSAFNAAFVGLMGRAVPLPDSEMAAFSDFVMPLAYPPNPNQFLNRTVRPAPLHQPSADRGRAFFFNNPTDGNLLTCNQCHAADGFGSGTNGQIINNNALQESQDMKVPQLRNLYKKTGFTDLPGAVNKRGFGFLHDGSIDNLFNFLKFPGFNFDFPLTQSPDENRRDVEAFLLSFDTGMAPSVGAQVTFRGPNNGLTADVMRLDTLLFVFTLGHCDLVAKGRLGGQPRGWWYQGSDQWMSDKTGESITTPALRALGGPGSEVTITGVPPGSGRRIGVDRDRDTWLDFDELLAGSDPGNPASTPDNVGVAGDDGPRPGLRAVRPNPFRSAAEIQFALRGPGRVDCVVHDVLGRRVRTVADGLWLDAGLQSLRWDGRREDGGQAGAGVYFVRLRTPDGDWTRPLVRVR